MTYFSKYRVLFNQKSETDSALSCSEVQILLNTLEIQNTIS